MKAEQACAIRGGAFRKERDILARVEQLVDRCIDDPRVAMAAATQKNRIVTCGEPANERPVADLGLGDESRWASGINCENVQPGDVVGNDEVAARGVAWRSVEGNRQDAQHLF